MEPISNTASVTKNLRLDSPGNYENPKAYYTFKGI